MSMILSNASNIFKLHREIAIIILCLHVLKFF